MAAPISGRKGRLYADVSVAGTSAAIPIANLNSWSINRSTDKIEVTAFGDSTKTYVVSLADAQGDFSGFWDTAGDQYKLSNAIDGGRKFYIYPSVDDPTKYWYGTAHWDVSVSSQVSGAVEVSGSWAAATSTLSSGF